MATISCTVQQFSGVASIWM